MAMVHESSSLDAEKQFFLSLNTRHAVSSNTIVKSWTGPGAAAIMKANASPSHPLHERVSFSAAFNNSRIGAAVVVVGALMAATGKITKGSIQVSLSRLDVAMGPAERRFLVEHYLRLLGQISPKGAFPRFVAQALGLAAWDRWSRGQEYPDRVTIARLAKINWKMEIPAFVEKYRPVVQNMIDKAWKKD
jgi:hypothetical protein